ncbi:CobW-like GTP-binding protein [Pseudomonas sp. AL03]|uniref:CobW family GTP-binding protein n=1 Tax=Pseudomonas sp. AL03 TaxID=3042230 RepID=UPI002499E06A|nr:CobW-like GTP-binding protein [Pseudomonas sp. AL03]MDI3275685.1 CobW-like GTP-binding protein [Pseudomonas sp. AL03]
MLQNIPTHVIAGPLGAGKTSLIKNLLMQRPVGERWAVLINEFGQIGLDAALLTQDADGIALGEVAGGCLCCVNGAPFQIGLGRLLRKARPDRLFIEPSGLGHPAQLLRQLSEAPWHGVLAIQPCVLVLDAQALAAGKPLPEAQQEALSSAGLLLLNKAEGLDANDRQRIAAQLPSQPLYWTQQALLPLSKLPGFGVQAVAGVDNFIAPKGLAQMPAIWTDPALPICLSQEQEGGWSVGWRWHPSQTFDAARVGQWLESLVWRRAKLVIHSVDGWVSANALENSVLNWQPSEWRRDSRIELIFSEPQDIDSLQRDLANCRLSPTQIMDAI